MKLNKTIKHQIITNIRKKFTVKEIILFGSYAWGNPGEYSDIDLLVVLDENGFFKKFMERINKKVEISSAMNDLEKEYSIDLLLYTKDEWKRLIENDSFFIRNINQNGVRLI